MNHLRALALQINSGAILSLSTPFPEDHGVPVATTIIAQPTPPSTSPSIPFIRPASPAYPNPIMISAPVKQTPVKPIPRNLASVIASFPTREGNFNAINGTVIIQSM